MGRADSVPMNPADHDHPDPISALVRGWRRTTGLTQQQLAQESGISIGSLRDLEQGRLLHPPPRSLDRLADALRLNPRQRKQLVHAARARRPRPAKTTPPADGTPMNTDELHLSVLGTFLVHRR